MKHTQLQTLPARIRNGMCQQCRQLHARISYPVPSPTPFVPDTKAFLTLIGRGLSKQESKIPSWEALFSLSGAQLRESGVEPARARRYLLWWRERYRQGVFGVGGDLQNVKDGIAELRVAQVPKENGKHKAVVINPPISDEMLRRLEPAAESEATEDDAGTAEVTNTPAVQISELETLQASEYKELDGIRVVAQRPSCSGIEYVKGDKHSAVLRIKEGLWEQKRGIKVDGGERRRAEVRAKRRAAERRAAR